MKYLITLVLALLLVAPSITAQSEDKWEELGERLARKAERIAERAERQAETAASKWEAAAERFGERFERQWDRNPEIRIENFPKRITINCCPEVFLGIEASDISKEKAQKLGFQNFYGSYVSKVYKNTAAANAGLQPFDYVYGINEQRTSDNQDLADILEDFEAGDEVTIHFVRNGQGQSANAKLVGNDDFDFDDEPDERAFLGVSPGEDEDDDDMDGVTIETVENSTAADLGLKDGDVITALNGRPVLDWDDLTTAVSNAKPGDEIEVVFRRDGKEMKSRKPLKAYHEVYPEEDDDNDEEDEEEHSEGNWNFNWNDDGDEMEDEDGEGAFLGVYIETISEEKAQKLGFDNPYGSYVSGVIDGGAAQKAGLQAFDYIFGIDEYRAGQNQSLTGILRKFKPEDKATVHYVRKGQKQKTEVVFTSHFSAKEKNRDSCESPFLGINESGSGDESMDGVKISPVKNSTAAEIGLEEGDIITAINGFKMVDWSDITMAIKMLAPGETISVDYTRNGTAMKGSKPIKSYAQTKNCKDCDCDRISEVIVSVNPPEKFNFNFRSDSKSEFKGERADVSKVKVTVEDMSSSEASTLQSKGVETTSASPLAIENLSLVPDANKGLFKLEFGLPSSGNTTVKVFNAAGRAIYEYELGKFSGKFSDEVDISQNGPGNYFLQIVQDNKVFNKKIVLQGS